jgi:hypothetical protein
VVLFLIGVSTTLLSDGDGDTVSDIAGFRGDAGLNDGNLLLTAMKWWQWWLTFAYFHSIKR